MQKINYYAITVATLDTSKFLPLKKCERNKKSESKEGARLRPYNQRKRDFGEAARNRNKIYHPNLQSPGGVSFYFKVAQIIMIQKPGKSPRKSDLLNCICQSVYCLYNRNYSWNFYFQGSL